jgi:hypothetical protein
MWEPAVSVRVRLRRDGRVVFRILMILRDWTEAGKERSGMPFELNMESTHMKDRLDTIWREKNYKEAWHETNTCTSDGIQFTYQRHAEKEWSGGEEPKAAIIMIQTPLL